MSPLGGVLALGGALLCVTCSLVISGETEPLRCSAEGQRGPPACDPGFVCRAGLCRAETGGAAAVPGGGGAAASAAGDNTLDSVGGASALANGGAVNGGEANGGAR